MKLRRAFRILNVIKAYDLVDFIPDRRLKKGVKLATLPLFFVRKKARDQGVGARLRLAFEELGPIWIKFGQMLSTRRDLFSDEIAAELEKLQDHVAPFDGQEAKTIIETALGGNIETWFEDFSIVPIASASIAQVHTAMLKENQQPIVLKVLRPRIRETIDADLALMFSAARFVQKQVDKGDRLRAVDVVRDYERTLLGELNLLREAANTMKLRHNFENSEALYIPKVYLPYCRENLLVEERIEGIPISDIETLKGWNTNFKLLAERGVEVFFTQVFRDNFFHADMHPGNIFVNILDPQNPQYIGIDCAIVGSLRKEDQYFLAENFIAFFKRDYRRIAELYVNSGWVPTNTDLLELENEMRLVCDPIFEKPLAEISFGQVLLNLFRTAKRFDMEIQPQLVLLEKTLLYVEGLGRQLYPELDLWVTAKPFLEKWMKEQRSVKAFLRSAKANLPVWQEMLPTLPLTISQNAHQSKLMRMQLERLQQQIVAQQDSQKWQKRLCWILAICVVVLVCYLLNQ